MGGKETNTEAVEPEAVEDEQGAADVQEAVDVQDTDAADVPEEPDSPDDEDGPLSRQAARFRKRCRELETELAAAQETITGMRRQQAEALAGAQGLTAAALWAVTNLDDLVDDGQISPEKVKAAVTDAATKLGVQPKKVGLHVPGEGRLVRPPGQDGRTRWDAAFKPSYRR